MVVHNNQSSPVRSLCSTSEACRGMASSSPLSSSPVSIPVAFPQVEQFYPVPVCPSTVAMTTSSSTLSPPESPPPLASSVLPQEERPDEEDPHEHSPPPHPPSAKALGKRRAQETEIIADHQPPNGVVLKPIKSKGTKNTSKKGKKGVHAKEEEKEATTTQRRVQPARSRRGGPGIGSSAVDVMILESHQRAGGSLFDLIISIRPLYAENLTCNILFAKLWLWCCNIAQPRTDALSTRTPCSSSRPTPGRCPQGQQMEIIINTRATSIERR